MEDFSSFDTGKQKYSIKAVENALVVMEALSEMEGEVALSQLSQRLGMDKSYIFRLLATFERRGYVEQEKKTGKYRVGISAYEIGQRFLSRMTLLRNARPVMQTLAGKSCESVYLTVLVRPEVLMLEMVDTPQQVKIVPLIGKRYPAYRTSAGRVILAFGDDPPPDPDLSPIRQHGVCSETGGFGADISSAAVPVFNSEKEVLGSLCILGPDYRFEPKRLEQEIVPALQTAGKALSSTMGFLDDYLN